MSEGVVTVDLRSLDLSRGAAVRLRLRVPPVALRLGGQDYVGDPSEPEADLEVSRSLAGLHFGLRLHAELVGPCWRCVGPARLAVHVDATEYVADGRSPEDPFDEDLDSAYLEATRLDVGLWARDAIAESLPAVVLCRDDCAGLCPECGIDRNVATCDCAAITCS